MAILVAIMGCAAIFTISTDIFPYIKIPVVSVVWSYTGISSIEMQNRAVTGSERAMTTNVSNIQHIESQSYKVSL